MSDPTPNTHTIKGALLINGFVFDASLTETHTREADVTQFPIESSGVTPAITPTIITDNRRRKPITVEIEGIVTDTPLPGPIANSRGTTDSKGNFAHAPSDDGLAALEAIDESGEPVEIVTQLKTYQNMLMTSLVIPRDAETGFALRFTATFEQATFITNNRTMIRVAPPQDTGLGAKKDLGNKVVYDLKDSASVWHHSAIEIDAGGIAHQGIEPLGTSNKDLREGKAGLYHITGAELTEDELAEYNRDEQAWSHTHDDKGNPTSGGAGVGLNGTSNSGGTVHSTEAVFQQSDGTWVDSAGQPVVYSPAFGNWIEVGDL